MYKLINGYTLETMKAKIRQYVGEDRCWSPDPGGGCSYRQNTDGVERRCALGAFFPDDSSPTVFSSGSYAKTLLMNFPNLREHMPLPAPQLAELQAVHDECKEGNVQEAVLAWIDEKCEEAAVVPA